MGDPVWSVGTETKKAQVKMIEIEQMPTFPIEPEETQEVVADVTTPPAEQVTEETTVAEFMLSLFQIADQAKIIHLQTDSDTEHRHFGLFYDTFTGQIDALIEGIAGKYGAQTLKFGQAQIVLYDREEAIQIFFEVVDQTLRLKFASLFDKETDSELYNMVDEMITLKNKVQYLLQMKRN